MRQHHRIQPRRNLARNLLRRQRQMRIDVRRILPPSLKQPAVQQHILPGGFNVVARPGDGLVRPPEMNTNCHALSSCSGRALAKHSTQPHSRSNNPRTKITTPHK